ncbi:MAG: hypothetical protein ABEH40_01085 [Haloferacaceae archaeon]
MSSRLRRLAAGRTEPDPAATGLGAAFVALAGVSVWTAAVGRAVQFAATVAGVPYPVAVVSVATSVLGPVAGSVAYARYRGFDLGLGRPRRGTRAAAVAAVVGPVLTAALVSAVGNAAAGVPLSAMADRWVDPEMPVGGLLVRVVLPAAALGVGSAFPVCGVAVESARAAVGSADAARVGALVAGYYRLLPLGTVGRLPLDPGGAYELAVTLVFGAAFGAAVGVLYRAFDGGGGDGSGAGTGPHEPGAARPRRDLAVLAVAAIGVVGVATGPAGVGEAVVTGLWVLTFGLAAAGYARTRSVWVAALSVAGFAVGLAVLVYAEASLGLVAAAA